MSLTVVEYCKTKWGKESPDEIVAQIAQGYSLPTEALGYSNNIQYRTQVVKAGGVDKIMEFFLKTNQPFRDVFPPPSTIDNNEQQPQIECPSVWLNVLSNFCQDGFLQPKGTLGREMQLKIMINMGPLFQDMNNFEQRSLFGSQDVWCKCLMFFCNMLYSLVTSDFSKLPAFIRKQAAFSNFLVRVLCLELSDPSIAKYIDEFTSQRETRVPKPDILGLSQTFCACTIKHMIMTPTSPPPTAAAAAAAKAGGGAQQQQQQRQQTALEEFGSTPIRPEHDLVLATAMFPLFQTNKRPGWYQGGFSAMLSVFILMFDRVGRLSGPFKVDSASGRLVTVCHTYLVEHAVTDRDRFFLENILTSIVTIGSTFLTPAIKGGKQAPIDFNVACAIDAGLMEFILDCCDTGDVRLSKPIDGLLRTLALTMSLDDTKKALEKRVKLLKHKAERVKDRHPYLMAQVALMEELLDKNNLWPKDKDDGLTCEFCQDKVTKEDMKKCPFCKSVCYCSMDCQQLNWMLHQKDCKTIRKTPPPMTDEEMMNQGKALFSKHVTQILLQAVLKGVNVLDVCVVIDMCEMIPVFRTLTPEQFGVNYVQQDQEQLVENQKVFDRNKTNGALTVSFAGFRDDGLAASLMTFPPSTAPDHAIPAVKQAEDKDKWRTAQLVVAQSSLGQGGLEKLQSNPGIWRGALLKTMKP